MPAEQLHEPWRSFLHDIDAQLSGPTEIHCLGGFVVAEYYGLARPTSDVDIIQVRGASSVADVQRIGGKGSALAKKHRVYIDIVTVAEPHRLCLVELGILKGREAEQAISQGWQKAFSGDVDLVPQHQFQAARHFAWNRGLFPTT